VGESARLVRLARLSRAAKEAEAAAKAARGLRDAEIDQADAEGFGVREIARACEVSPATVVHALEREARRRG
jgi:DNA-binding NarL/FixJ family response regulator